MLGEKIDLAFIYVEMNGFDVNYDRWFCDPFGYSRVVDHRELDDLSGFEAEIPWQQALTLTGMEAMQEAFRWWHEETDHRDFKDEATLANLLVQCRYLALMRDAVALDRPGVPVPVAAGTHGSDIVFRFDPPEQVSTPRAW
jgi:hypothetical protein